MSASRPDADAARPPTAKAAAWRSALRSCEADGRATAAAAELATLLAAEAPHAPSAAGFARCCLRAKQYDARKALRLAADYARFRARPGWSALSAGATEAELRTGMTMLLPEPDAYGQTVLTQRMASFDLSLAGTSAERYQRAGFYVAHRALQRPGTQLCGVALLLDFRGFRWSHMRALQVADFRRGASMLQDCCPARLVAVYVVHQPAWLGALVALLKPFLARGSLEGKLHLLGSDLDALRTHAPRLPETLGLGGTAAAFDWQAVVDGWAAEEAARPGLDALALLEVEQQNKIKTEEARASAAPGRARAAGAGPGG